MPLLKSPTRSMAGVAPIMLFIVAPFALAVMQHPREKVVGSHATQSVTDFSNLVLPKAIEIPCWLNIIFLCSPDSPLGDLDDRHLLRWIESLDNTVRHRIVYRKSGKRRLQRKWGSHQESEFLSVRGTEVDNHPLRYKYIFNTIKLNASVAETFGLFLAKVARRDAPPSSGYTIDVDEVSPRIEKLVECLGKHDRGIELASTLFVVDIPLVIDTNQGSQTITQHAYRRGWSDDEIASLVKNPHVQLAAEDARRRRDDARLGLGFSDDSILETDVMPADVKPHPPLSKVVLNNLSNSEGEATTISSMEAESGAWLAYMEADMQKIHEHYPLPSDSRDPSGELALRILEGDSTPRQEALLSAMEWQQMAQEAELDEIRGSGRHGNYSDGDTTSTKRNFRLSGCLFDAWVADARFAWIDLRAKGCSRGEMGAESVSSAHGSKIGTIASTRQMRKKEHLAAENAEIVTKKNLHATFEKHQLEIKEQIEILRENFEIACQKETDGRPFDAYECESWGRHLHEARQRGNAYKNAIAKIVWSEMPSEMTTGELPTAILRARGFYLAFIDGMASNHDTTTGKIGVSNASLELLENFKLLTSLVSSFMRHVVTPPTAIPPPSFAAPRRMIKQAHSSTYLGFQEREPTDDLSILHSHYRLETQKPFSPALFARTSQLHTHPVHALDMRRVEHVAFHIHLVSVDGSSSIGSQGRGTTSSSILGGFDMALFKKQMLRLRAPDQEFSFTFQHISLDDDTALSMAFHSSMRFSVEANLLDIEQLSGKLKPRKRHYVDATHLRHQLRIVRQQENEQKVIYRKKEKNKYTRSKGSVLLEPNVNSETSSSANIDSASHRENHLASRNIPIFIFSYASGGTFSDISENLPILIDRNHIARATPDMVFVMQHMGNINFNSEDSDFENSVVSGSGIHWETLVACNGRSVNANLMNPVREALRATATVLGGLIPAHVGRQHQFRESKRALNRKKSTKHLPPRQYHDWKWAVGKSPLALTETGPGVASFSQFNIDALHRAHIIQALKASRLILQASFKILATTIIRSPASKGAISHSLNNVVLRKLSRLNWHDRHHRAYNYAHHIEEDIKDFDTWWHSGMLLQEGLNLLEERWNSVAETQNGMITDMETLNFPSALQKVSILLRVSREIFALAEAIGISLEPHSCADERVASQWTQLRDKLRETMSALTQNYLIVLLSLVLFGTFLVWMKFSPSNNKAFRLHEKKVLKIN